MRTWFFFGGAAFLVVGAVSTVWALVAGGPAALGAGIMGVTFFVVGGTFFFVSNFLKKLDPSEILKSGTPLGAESGPAIPGIAQIAWTRDTGVILNNVNLVVQVGLMVTVDGQPAYEAETRHVLYGRNQWGALQPGMTVPVLVNPNDKTRVVIDTNRPVVSAAASGAISTIGGATQVTTQSNADIVAIGLKTTGKLSHVTPTGMTAGQAKPGLPAEQADDPVMHLIFTYVGQEGNEMRGEILVRVPDGKGHLLVPGAAVGVSYLPDSPDNATIDWDNTN